MSKQSTGIHYNEWHGKHQANVYSNGKRIFLGYYPTKSEAIIAQEDYKNRTGTNSTDYNLLAHDPKAWTERAHEVIKQLSNRPDAVKVMGL